MARRRPGLVGGAGLGATSGEVDLRGGEADSGVDGAFAGGAGGEGAERPVAGGRVEAEVTGGVGYHLGGELAGGVQQPDERAGDRGTGAQHLAGDDGVLLQVDALQVAALGGRAAHQTSFSIGTPTSEPYSVQEPS